MHIISEKALKRFWAGHPDAEAPLRAWIRRVERARWESFADPRADYPSADRVGDFIVFNIGGNKYRMVAAVHFNRGRIYVRPTLTPKEYDRGDWKEG